MGAVLVLHESFYTSLTFYTDVDVAWCPEYCFEVRHENVSVVVLDGVEVSIKLVSHALAWVSVLIYFFRMFESIIAGGMPQILNSVTFGFKISVNGSAFLAVYLIFLHC